MSTIQIAICDDSEKDQKIIRQCLKKLLENRGHEVLITQFTDGEPLVCDYEEGEAFYDLIIIDLFMRKPDGISTAKRIRKVNKNVALMFLTTTSDYALEGYDVRAIGYLMKPLEWEKLEQVIQRFLQETQLEEKKRLFFKTGTQIHQIAIREISCIESERRVLNIYRTDGAVFHFYGKLDEVEKNLPEKHFLRCHKSFLVNLYHVQMAAEKEFIMEDGRRIPIRHHSGGKIRDIFYRYLLEQAATAQTAVPASSIL